MKFAVGTILDQTYGYLTDNGSFTIKHPEAKLFDTRFEAEQEAEKCDSTMPTVDLEGKPYTKDHLEAMKCFIESVEDEKEFRAREDTW